HCENIIQLVQIHFFVHPLIPTENCSKSSNLQEIWINCIKEQHNYCKDNDLAHIWAYLWNEWYQPER
ncbi:hypothetical protein C2G38_1957977, partial [Gigaspora rosea]